MSEKEFRERYPNIVKLTDYINQQEEPERFMQVLFALVGPKKEAEKK
mgnify:FL=1